MHEPDSSSPNEIEFGILSSPPEVCPGQTKTAKKKTTVQLIADMVKNFVVKNRFFSLFTGSADGGLLDGRFLFQKAFSVELKTSQTIASKRIV